MPLAKPPDKNNVPAVPPDELDAPAFKLIFPPLFPPVPLPPEIDTNPPLPFDEEPPLRESVPPTPPELPAAPPITVTVPPLPVVLFPEPPLTVSDPPVPPLVVTAPG